MISETSFTSNGQTETTSKDNSRKAVIEFLDTHLQNFPANFMKRTSKLTKIKENLISQELEFFLNRKSSNEVFRFKGQWQYGDSSREPDFGVYEVEDRNPFGLTREFFVIEAKLLPTGKKDYVFGDLGGIQRFKKGHHGKGLLESAMIGYVQKGTCSHWHSKINTWIGELIKTNTVADIIWNQDDLLIHSDDFDKVQKYVSENKRICSNQLNEWLGGDSIKLHHYLMELV
jgi:hypothetical protein